MRIDDASVQRNALPIGMAKLTRLAFAGVDLGRIAGQLRGMFERDPAHAGALMDLSVIDQLNGDLSIGLERQALALRQQRVFHSTCCGAKPRLRVLAFVAAADIGANTPLEFLLEGSDIALTMAYAMPGRPLPRELPDHDLAFVAIAATPTNRRLLADLEERLAYWPAPVVNLPARVSMLEPDDLGDHLCDVEGLRTPVFERRRRDELAAAAQTRALPFPLIVKPQEPANWDSEKIDGPVALASLLARRCDAAFHIAPFIDCRGADGLYRKIRVIFVDRRAYACHLAVSDGWNASHIDARMQSDPFGRSEEERFFATFDTDFAARHAKTFDALVERVGLTYFGVDCAETSSGELVVFKADHTLLVHDMDPVDVFPYKPSQMRKLFDAFSAYLYRAAGHARLGGRRRT
ncbi:hypothetical protein [Methylosinus sp. Sm6]|uniref:hypothetical protein n=1 Tax=Methylosinus sp. Sm6 TaxID=2866948 RepID=UPI00210496BF|nr:hypothetical protein [Methylosinus sp. Sm6]